MVKKAFQDTHSSINQPLPINLQEGFVCAHSFVFPAG
jgi:hypothetical protein